jgi:hypothetical protein
MKSLILVFYIYFIFLVNNAHAYLDPGTGSIILQALLGAIAATASYIIFYWNKVKIFFKKIFNKKKT